MMKVLFSVLLLLAAAAPRIALAATVDPCMSLGNVISRPTVTNAACVVEADHALLEAGYSNLTFSGSGNNVSFPQALLRIGTSMKHFEVDFQPPTENRTFGSNGLSDVAAGVKYLLGYSPRMQYSVQYLLTEPTGDQAFTAGAAQSTFSFNASYALSPALTLATSQNLAGLASNGVRYGAYSPTLVLSDALPHGFSPFGEVAFFTHAIGPASATRTQYMFGSTYSVNSRLQLDVEDFTSSTKSTGRYNGVGFGLGYLLR